MASLQELYEKLTEDRWRQEHPFSDDVQKVHEIAFHPFRTNTQREEAYLGWLKARQPCLFGRMAAVTQRIQFCFLGEEDFREGDEAVGRAF